MKKITSNSQQNGSHIQINTIPETPELMKHNIFIKKGLATHLWISWLKRIKRRRIFAQLYIENKLGEYWIHNENNKNKLKPQMTQSIIDS